MFLTEETEKLIHLIARAFAKTAGSLTPHVFADTMLEHAKAEAAAPVPAEQVAAEAADAPLNPALTDAHPTEGHDAAPSSTEPAAAPEAIQPPSA